MAFSKKTAISQHKDGEHKFFYLTGHWKIEAAINFARTHGIKGAFTITHMVHDRSGHGRGGQDGRWQVGSRNGVTGISKGAHSLHGKTGEQ